MLVHMDNFAIYGGVRADLLNGVYAEIFATQLVADPDGISPGFVAQLDAGGASTTGGLRFVLPTNVTKLGIALRVWFPALPDGSNGVPAPMIWRDGSNNAIACITVDTTGRIDFRIGDWNGTVNASTPNPVISANGWYHLEGLLDITAETFELRVEGVAVITAGAFGLAGTISQILTGLRSTITSAVRIYQIKDLVVYDGTGTYNHTFLGSVLVVNLSPTADVALNWTPSTGANGYSILDNVPPDDAQYISAPNPPPAAYVCEMSNLPIDVTSVKGLMSFVRAAKTDGGDASLQVGVKSGASTVLGADRPITIAQTYWRDVFETDPATAAPWLPSAVDAARLQLNRTT
jgi:hypothetical protein